MPRTSGGQSQSSEITLCTHSQRPGHRAYVPSPETLECVHHNRRVQEDQYDHEATDLAASSGPPERTPEDMTNFNQMTITGNAHHLLQHLGNPETTLVADEHYLSRDRPENMSGVRYTAKRLDAACRRALDVDLIDVRRVERILVQALEEETTPQAPMPLPKGRFARPGNVFAQTDHYRRRTA